MGKPLCHLEVETGPHSKDWKMYCGASPDSNRTDDRHEGGVDCPECMLAPETTRERCYRLEEALTEAANVVRAQGWFEYSDKWDALLSPKETNKDG